ncbi:AAA family ATPase [Geobacillus sp. WSUCF-018B]|uniref:AAA family ATPase n=1 Tax=Geobacillus sp. WSUCF-018B TaxID=2055939 RepID=UPI000C289146|nr:AAA family ATPase [Geobacillus sp. WSUCF-018B]PJW18887.1 hypothetical protein CV944_01395 [Geobacillus sp. WSUCF-018B]
MGYEKTKEEIRDVVLSGYPLLHVITDDERPVIETFHWISNKYSRKYDVLTWNYSSGLVLETGEIKTEEVRNPLDLFKKIKGYPRNAIFVLHDFHIFFQNKEILLELKDTVLHIAVPVTNEFLWKRYSNVDHRIYKHIVITSPKQEVPLELNKLMHVIRFGLPGRKEIEEMIDVITKKTTEQRKMSKEEKERIINASLGLTETEIFNAYIKSMLKNKGKIDPKTVANEKRQIVEKEGVLEYYEPDVSISEIGGLKPLIDWIQKRKIAYNEEIRKKYGLNLPKGLLMTGIQGCGKSYTAKAIANFLEVPMLRLDIGALMNKWLGQSEENIRKAIQLAENIAPCVLFIDEIDKAIPDPTSSNTHEVSKRILSTLLTWLQEKKSPVFVVATANNIENLPPEFMRKGRFDEIFFVDLPKKQERKEIFAIHLKKKGYDPRKFDLDLLTEKTEGFSGSEIEALINEGIFQAAYDQKSLEMTYLLKEIEQTSPLSQTMGDRLKQIQEWAIQNKLRRANY